MFRKCLKNGVMIMMISMVVTFGSQALADIITLDSFIVGTPPAGLAVDQGGKVWFTQRAQKNLVRLDPATRQITTFAAPYTGNPEAILVAPDNSIWITSIPMENGNGNAKLARFDQETEVFEEFMINIGWTNNYAGTISLGDYGLSLAPDGRIWFNDRSHVNNYGWGSIAHIGFIDHVEKVVTVLDTVPEAANTDVAVSSDGQVYYPAADDIYRYDEATQTSFATGAGVGYSKLFPDRAGSVWYGESGYGACRISSDGTITKYPLFESPGGANSVGRVVFDSKNIGWFAGGGRYFGRLDAQSGSIEWSDSDMTNGIQKMAVDSEDNIWVSGADLSGAYRWKISKVVIDFDNDGYENKIDCNDGDDAINPGAYEMPYNGIDENCNGMADDSDADGDGFGVDEDCDDANPLAFPGALETNFDGVDQDCNGYDLTIDISEAKYIGKKDQLEVKASSDLNETAMLNLDGYGPLIWTGSRWELTVTNAGGNPGMVTISGIEGSESTNVTDKK